MVSQSQYQKNIINEYDDDDDVYVILMIGWAITACKYRMCMIDEKKNIGHTINNDMITDDIRYVLRWKSNI